MGDVRVGDVREDDVVHVGDRYFGFGHLCYATRSSAQHAILLLLIYLLFRRNRLSLVCLKYKDPSSIGMSRIILGIHT